MRYTKWICAACTILIIIVSMISTQYINTDYRRIHQHMEEIPEPCPTVDEGFCTHLPIIKISTDGKEIPGDPILTENLGVEGYTLAADGSPDIVADISIIDNSGRNHLDDPAAVTSLANLRKRGNSSRLFSKKSYRMELVDDEGLDNPKPIMGMSKHREWALYGPFLDKTLMRNYMFMNISAEIMGYAPNVRYCELFINDQYQGLYITIETIERGENRVNISKYKQGSRAFGYILKLDREKDLPSKINQFTQYTSVIEYERQMYILYPKTANLSEDVIKYIEKDVSRFEKALFSHDFDDKKLGYKNYIDVDSFVDYYILQEFLCVNDMCSLSTYLYKEAGGKLTMGPVWDYNNILNNFFSQDDFDGQEIYFANRLWYQMLMKDEDFVNKVIKRYKELRTTYLSEEYMIKYMDDTVAYLGEAIDRNYSVWGFSFDPSKLSVNEKLSPAERNPTSYQEAITDMKEFIKIRGDFMDRHISTLYQYCHKSKSKEYHE